NSPRSRGDGPRSVRLVAVRRGVVWTLVVRRPAFPRFLLPQSGLRPDNRPPHNSNRIFEGQPDSPNCPPEFFFLGRRGLLEGLAQRNQCVDLSAPGRGATKNDRTGAPSSACGRLAGTCFEAGRPGVIARAG